MINSWEYPSKCNLLYNAIECQVLVGSQDKGTERVTQKLFFDNQISSVIASQQINYVMLQFVVCLTVMLLVFNTFSFSKFGIIRFIRNKHF
jgi:hypothetical protein